MFNKSENSIKKFLINKKKIKFLFFLNKIIIKKVLKICNFFNIKFYYFIKKK